MELNTETALLYMITQLGNIAEIKTGYPFRSRLEADPLGDVSVIQMKDITDTNLLDSDSLTKIAMPQLKEKHVVRYGDLIFRSRGQTNTVAVVETHLERTIVAAPMMTIRTKPEILLPQYLKWFINTNATQSSLSRQAEGSTVQMISKATLEALVIAIPSIAHQKKIIALAALAEKESALAKEISALRQHLVDSTLMNYATGEHQETAASENKNK